MVYYYNGCMLAPACVGDVAAEWPSATFYDGDLDTAPSVAARSPLCTPALQPYLFFDIANGQESVGGISRANDVEVSCVH